MVVSPQVGMPTDDGWAGSAPENARDAAVAGGGGSCLDLVGRVLVVHAELGGGVAHLPGQLIEGVENLRQTLVELDRRTLQRVVGGAGHGGAGQRLDALDELGHAPGETLPRLLALV